MLSLVINSLLEEDSDLKSDNRKDQQRRALERSPGRFHTIYVHIILGIFFKMVMMMILLIVRSMIVMMMV